MKTIEKYWIAIVIIFVICMFTKPILCFIILGPIMFFIAFDYLRVLTILKKNGIKTTGKILKYVRGNKCYQTPIINFIIENGKIIESEPYFYSATDINKFRTFKNYIEKPIEIKYNPEMPEEFLIEDQKVFNEIMVYLIMLISSIFFIVGIFDIIGIISVNFK